eukprot:8834191-Pyramimonas_sp.AAC.1
MPPRRSERTPSPRKIAPRCSGWPPDGPRGIQDALMMFHCFFEECWRSRLFGLPTLQDGPRGLQDRLKTGPEVPRRAPR